MDKHLDILKTLTAKKSHNEIKSYLESLDPTSKGSVFESYLAFLYKGNGYEARVMGGKGDLGADILLYNPKVEKSVYFLKKHKIDILILLNKLT